MKTKDFLNYLIELKIQDEEMPKIREIAKANGVSPTAIWKNIQQLMKMGILENYKYGKYRLKIEGTHYERNYLIRKVKYLKEWKNFYQQKYWSCEDSNNDLEKSYADMKKALEFKESQNKIMNGLVQKQRDLIQELEAKLYEKNQSSWIKRIWFRILGR